MRKSDKNKFVHSTNITDVIRKKSLQWGGTYLKETVFNNKNNDITKPLQKKTTGQTQNKIGRFD